MTKPLLTVLNFSAGVQSSAILWMVLKGIIPRPKNFLVLNADPGMENNKTYSYVAMMFPLCEKAGIKTYTAPGPNLFYDLLNIHKEHRTHLSQPPFWTKGKDGKVGRLRQHCTREYKVAPMDRAIRIYLEENFGISRKTTRLGEGLVEKWIGFTLDEVMRVKPSRQKYIAFAYPLIDMGLDKAAVIRLFTEHGWPLPSRSVCNACFANGLETLKEMYHDRPDDWAQAVAVDDAVRDLSCIGVERPVYVSKSLIPLRELPALDFRPSDVDGDDDGHSCDSGYCFV